MKKSRPILFSPAMSWAVIEGKKTQTRRTVKLGANDDVITRCGSDGEDKMPPWPVSNDEWMKCPYGSVGDLLWVREEHYRFGHWRALPGVKTKTGKQKWAFIPDSDQVLFVMPPLSFRKGRDKRDPETKAWHKRLARFMPRSSSRTTLEITEIRVERLQDISVADVEAEGIERRTIACRGTPNGLNDVYGWASSEEWGDLKVGKWAPHEVSHGYAPHAYGALWNRINGADSEIGWDKNPFVWCLTFKVVS